MDTIEFNVHAASDFLNIGEVVERSGRKYRVTSNEVRYVVTAKRVRNFIITDPCYIMDDKQYQKICESGADFESQTFPLASKHEKTGQQITFHTIVSTPNGDGSCEFNGERVGVDAGMLCIAECAEGWDESYGATFSSLEVAQEALPNLLKNF